MKITNLTALLSVLSPLASATCFTTGVEGNRDLAHSKVSRMCDFLSGDYAPGQAKHHAFTYSDGSPFCLDCDRRWDFWITNTRNVGNFNAHNGCVEFLNREINCLLGGQSVYPDLGWIFQADPNVGACVINCEL